MIQGSWRNRVKPKAYSSVDSWLVSHLETIEIRRDTDAYGCTAVEHLLPNGETATLSCVTQESLEKSWHNLTPPDQLPETRFRGLLSLSSGA